MTRPNLPEGFSYIDDEPKPQRPGLPEGFSYIEPGPSIGKTAGGLARQVGGAAVAGGGAVVRGIGELANSDTIRKAGDAVTGYGQGIQQGAAESFKQAVSDTTPSGDVLSPSTWSLGENPSVTGALGQFAGALGSTAPTIAAAALTKGRALPTAAIGGALEGGAAAQEQSERITSMSDADIQQVPRYRELLASGMAPAAARAELARSTGRTAAAYAAPVGAAGGLIEGAPFMRPVQDAISSLAQGRLGRAAVAGTAGALTEGAQEASVGMAGVAGANQATGEQRSITEGSFANAALGAGVGGALGGAAGLASPSSIRGPAEDGMGGNITLGLDATPEEEAAFDAALRAETEAQQAAPDQREINGLAGEPAPEQATPVAPGVAPIAGTPRAEAPPIPEPKGPISRGINALAEAGTLEQAVAAGQQAQMPEGATPAPAAPVPRAQPPKNAVTDPSTGEMLGAEQIAAREQAMRGAINNAFATGQGLNPSLLSSAFGYLGADRIKRVVDEVRAERRAAAQAAAPAAQPELILGSSGNPFKSEPAVRRAASQNPGTEIVAIKGGWALRKIDGVSNEERQAAGVEQRQLETQAAGAAAVRSPEGPEGRPQFTADQFRAAERSAGLPGRTAERFDAGAQPVAADAQRGLTNAQVVDGQPQGAQVPEAGTGEARTDPAAAADGRPGLLAPQAAGNADVAADGVPEQAAEAQPARADAAGAPTDRQAVPASTAGSQQAVTGPRPADDGAGSAQEAPQAGALKTQADRVRTAAASEPPGLAKTFGKLADAIEARNEGALNNILGSVGNKKSREAFQAATGVSLPKTVRGTKAAITAWAQGAQAQAAPIQQEAQPAPASDAQPEPSVQEVVAQPSKPKGVREYVGRMWVDANGKQRKVGDYMGGATIAVSTRGEAIPAEYMTPEQIEESIAAGKAARSAQAATGQAAQQAPAPEQETTNGDDWLGEFFTPEADASMRAMDEADAREQSEAAARRAQVAKAMRAEADAAKGRAADWSSRTYKGNRSAIDFDGDGPGRESQSIGSINEGRKRRAIEQNNAVSAALERAAAMAESGNDAQIRDAVDRARAADAAPGALSGDGDRLVGALFGAGNTSGKNSIGARIRAIYDRQAQPTAQQSAQATEQRPEAFEHAGLRIYPINVRSEGRSEPRWAVQLPENRGTDKVLGDTLHRTVEEAKASAERESARFEADQARDTAANAEREQREAQDASRKAANRGKTIGELRADATLDKAVTENGKTTTRREWVEAKVQEGLEPRVTQEDKIKPMSRTAFNRATNEEQRAHDRRVKAAGKKDVHWIGDYQVTKAEHDYAVSLREKAPEQQEAAPAQPPAAPAQETQTAPERQPAAEAPATPARIENFGEALPGGRAEAKRALDRELTREDIERLPLSKIWPLSDIENIEDKFQAALAYAIRGVIPTKPQKGGSKLRGWVDKVEAARGMASEMLAAKDQADLIGMMRQYSRLMEGFAAKVQLLDAINRKDWSRIGEVREYPDAYRTNEAGEREPSPFVGLHIDDKRHLIGGVKTIAEAMNSIGLLLAGSDGKKRMQFEIRRATKTGEIFINKAGDSERRRLKTFTEADAARAFLRDNYDELVVAWDAVKDRDNVSKADTRREANRPRTGADRRNGQDASDTMFQEAFGFRGVEFGKWVSQGKGAKERQGLVNEVYDAFMDLSDITGLPPRAMSLGGTLGLALGSRGKGWASAHFEPGNLVINLTKTRGAGALAHEWFHALDNYFARQRGGEVPIQRGMKAQEAYRANNFITYRPEPMMVHKTQASTPITKARLAQMQRANPGAGYFKPENWQVDPKHPQGVRTEVERGFAELVDALDSSPMTPRARANDKAEDGYWGQILERAARAFENFTITRMMEKGFQNDFLANVTPIEDFRRSADRYPYLLPEEVAPIAQAFDSLFGTIRVRNDAGKSILFSRRDVDFKVKPPARLYRGVAKGLQSDGSDGLGTFMLGRGLYSSPSKSFAKKYGNVLEVSSNEAFPRNPLVLRVPSGSSAPDAFLNWVVKDQGFKSLRDFNSKHRDPGEYVRSLGYDGVIAGDEVVRYFGREENFSRRDGESRPGTMRRQVIEGMANRIAGNWTVPVRVVETPQDLPAAIQAAAGEGLAGVDGVIDGEAIYLVASNITSPRHALTVLAHEGVGHFGMEGLLGDRFQQTLDDVIALRDAGKLDQAVVDQLAERYPGVDDATWAKEAIAVMAERGVENSVMARVIAAAKRLLRELGFKVQFSEADLRAMIGDAARFVRDGEGRRNLSAAQGSPDFSFAGMRSRTASARSSLTAMSRISKGEDAETVRQETGWFKGADDQWRYEISDRDARIKLEGAQTIGSAMKGSQSTVGRVLDHPALFAAYPELASLSLRLLPATSKSRGTAGADGIALRENLSIDEARSTLLHELQHGIQYIEDFATGGGVESVRSTEDYQQLSSYFERKGVPTPGRVAFEVYRRLAGEVEARNVQARAKLSDEFIKVFPPELTADVPASRVIVTIGGKVIPKAPRPANAPRAPRDIMAEYGIDEAGNFGSDDRPQSFGMVVSEAISNAPSWTGEALRFSMRNPQAQTAEFRRWFGDSKVVDAEGRPLVVYHGTAREFDQFDSEQNYGELDAFWFTGSRGYAQWMADGPSRRTANPGARVVDAFLSIKNPMVFDVLAEGKKVAEEIGVDAPATSMEAQEILSGGLGWDGVVADIVSDAKKAGHDGVVIENFSDNFPGGDTTAYLAFRPEQIKSATGNRGAFDPSDPRITFSRRAPTFYSAALRAVEEGKGAPKRADAAAWKGWLDGAVRRGDMKQSERDWLDIDGWLGRQDGPVARESLAEFVRSNEVQVSEVVLGRGGFTRGMREELERLSDIRRAERTPEQEARIRELQGLANSEDSGDGGAKFANHRTPGGENYRELLLTLPAKDSDRASFLTQQIQELERMAEGDRYGDRAEIMAEVDVMRQELSGLGGDARRDYRSSHWDQPNVLAHIRMDERTDADGKRVLFVQEIQSDWHQAGRKQGYQATALTKGESLRRQKDIFDRFDAGTITREQRNEELSRLSDDRQGLRGVPNAPLKQTDEWAMLAFKRAARWAVDNGFDRIAWATGEQNADLFDLSKQVESIGVRVTPKKRYVKIKPSAGAEIGLGVENDGTISGDSTNANVGKPLEDVIGKEMAERVMAFTENGELSGDGLKVGGEGMRGFYDKILPAAVNKWAKKFGAKVGAARVKTGSEVNQFLPQQYDDEFGIDDSIQDARVPGLSFNTYEQAEARAAEMNGGGTRVHAIDITPAMREAVQDGQPLFSMRRRVADAISNRNADARQTWLKALTRQQIVDVGRDQFEVDGGQNLASEFERLSRAMEADANGELERPIRDGGPSIGAVAETWAKGSSVFAGKAEQKAMGDMATLMHDTTLAGIDPTKRPSRESPEYKALRARYQALPAAQQQLYKDVRDAYAKRREDFLQALQDRIMASAGSTASKRAMADKLRAHFEAQKVHGPYFPLARFGDYWVRGKKADGSPVFHMTETQEDQRKTAVDLRQQGFSVKTGKSIKSLSAEPGVAPGFMADLAAMLDAEAAKGRIAPDGVEALKDGLYQMMLESLPEQSVRKHFIHRKGTRGFSTDALRAFSHQMGHGSKQLARLRFAHKIGDTVRAMRDAAEVAPDPNKAADIVKALDDTFAWMMNPTNARWANRLTSLGFAWYLGISPAAALVNMTQLPIVTLPVLAAQHGWSKAGAALLRGAKDYIASASSKSKRAKLDGELGGDMGRMLKEMEESGAIERTMTMSLFGLSDSETAVAVGGQRAMQAIGSFFQAAEKANREATAIAAYRLAREAGRGHDAARAAAYDAIFESHFDYSSSNRAAFMRGNMARVLLLFRQYSQNITYYLWRNAYKALKGATKEERREAATKLGGTLFATAAMAGAVGLPGYGMAMAAANMANAMFGDDDEPWDAKVAFRQWLTESFGQQAGDVIARGGANAATGLDFSSRTSLGDLWWRSPEQDLEGKDLAFHYLEQFAGPVFGIFSKAAQGMKTMQEGQTLRGLEQSVPKGIADVMKAVRFGSEGATTMRGDPVVEDFSAWNLVNQGMGMAPADLSDQYGRNRALKNAEMFVLDRRSSLLNAYALARRVDDTEGMADALTRMKAFNARWPRLAITADTIRASIRNRDRFTARAVNGMGVNPKLAEELLELTGY